MLSLIITRFSHRYNLPIIDLEAVTLYKIHKLKASFKFFFFVTHVTILT